MSHKNGNKTAWESFKFLCVSHVGHLQWNIQNHKNFCNKNIFPPYGVCAEWVQGNAAIFGNTQKCLKGEKSVKENIFSSLNPGASCRSLNLCVGMWEDYTKFKKESLLCKNTGIKLVFRKNKMK